MSYPERLPTGGKELDLFQVGTLTFERPDPEKFPALRMAYEALNQGGAACQRNGAAHSPGTADQNGCAIGPLVTKRTANRKFRQ